MMNGVGRSLIGYSRRRMSAERVGVFENIKKKIDNVDCEKITKTVFVVPDERLYRQ